MPHSKSYGPLARGQNLVLFSFFLFLLLASPLLLLAADVVSFPSGELTLQGVLYKPAGPGPFPAVVYNHGSAPGFALLLSPICR
jgi:hypothetical protein